MLEPLFGLAQFIVEMGDALAAKVLQLHPFQVVPDPFSRVQLWSMPWKLFQVSPPGPTSAQVALHRLTAMNGSAIPDDQQLSRNMPQQVLQEPDDIPSSVGPLLNRQVQLACWGDAAHSRKMVSSQRSTNNGGLPHFRSILVPGLLLLPSFCDQFINCFSYHRTHTSHASLLSFL
jgi:hypothetical protein